MQYSARRDSVRTNFPAGESLIILFNGQNAGWQYVAKLPDCIHLVEIMIASEFRGKGVGTALLGQLLDASRQSAKPVRLGVNAANTGAIRLYERMGFRRTGGDQIQLTMEYSPS